MLQITQNLKSGIMALTDVPFPSLNFDNVLVRNCFSLISSGTEISKVNTAKKGYLGKALEKPDQVRQVIDTIQKEGIVNAYKKVMNKLDSLNPLGYSSSGIVIGVGNNIKGFSIGDRVACGGQDLANHAEIIAVPSNLIVKIPDSVSFEDASFTTVAAIALQGIRQADLRLGESCLVIGLGLIGLLTVQMLKAAGIKVIGVDINPENVKQAFNSKIDIAFLRNDSQLESGIISATNGFGVDATIITAGSSSLDPIELSGRMCRQKGKVIIVGAVPTGFSREHFYKKELELKMSCSYGPGRYNLDYEYKGIDFPIGYVRWTENRNMQAFLELVSESKISPSILVSHVFDFNNALDAYDRILSKEEPFLGILLKYDQIQIPNKQVGPISFKNDKNDVKISFIGAGSFAQNSLLPNIKNASLISVATAESHNSKSVASKFGFQYAKESGDAVIKEENSNTLFIATRHDSHAQYVLEGLKANKNIFVEKPLCMTEEELISISQEYHQRRVHLMVGYNRRFSPIIIKIKKLLNPTFPVAINYRINSGFIPHDHWTQDIHFGGGRIIGEACHFIDLVMFLSSSKPIAVQAFAMNDPLNLTDTLTINLKFANGSIAAVQYFSNGSKELKKEYGEVFSSGLVMINRDFKEWEMIGRKKRQEKMINQDKGHKEEVSQFIAAIKNGNETPIQFGDIYATTMTTFKVLESLRENKVVTLNFNY